MSRFETLDGESWESFVAADKAVLMLGKTDCGACAKFSEEIVEFLADQSKFEGVRFGKLFLDQRGLIGFKKANPWLADVTDLPYTVIYKNGEISKKFVGGGIDRLTNRLERLT